ncbi:MAG TPA: hypothetical protein VKL40_00835 [Candidatus Angelobacter sp.]|nr:hypothetical protein [Candidatus Angelobacter sp.]
MRLLLVLAFVVVLGASVARGQDGTGVFNDQDKKSDQNKTQAKAKSNDSHRKHWWSPPHWFHKKHDNAAGKTEPSPFSKTDSKTVAAADAPKTSSTHQAVTGAHPTTKTVAKTGPAGQAGGQNAQKRKTSATAGSKKTVRHDCTPEQSKKTGCVVGKGNSQKTAANPS